MNSHATVALSYAERNAPWLRLARRFLARRLPRRFGGVSRTGTRGDSQSAQFHGHVIGPSIGGPIRAHVNLRAVFFVIASLLLGCAGLNRWTRGES
jgi:hypothetical protein